MQNFSTISSKLRYLSTKNTVTWGVNSTIVLSILLQADVSHKHYCYDLHYTPREPADQNQTLITGHAWSRQVKICY